jgi:prolyl oligopeptidase PreP (S9A serine peptidase family)
MTVHTDDDRVMPGGPYKFAAALQTAQPDGTFLLRLRSGAGHHASADHEGDLDERADILAFLGDTLGLTTC